MHDEIGMIITWFENADREQAKYWRAERYLSEAHYSNELIRLLHMKLLSETECRMPFSLADCRFERIHRCGWECVDDDEEETK